MNRPIRIVGICTECLRGFVTLKAPKCLCGGPIRELARPVDVDSFDIMTAEMKQDLRTVGNGGASK